MPKSWHVLAFAWLFCAVPDFERTPGVAFLAASLICPRIVRMCNMCLNISVVHAPAYLANFSERIRERKLLHSSFFTLALIFIDHLTRKCLPPSYRPSFKELIYNSRKYRMFFILPSSHQNMSRN